MKIKLISSIDYKKLEKILDSIGDEKIQVMKEIESLENERKCEIVGAAGKLSRTPGKVSDIINKMENNTYEKNMNFVKRILGYGHTSILEHDYCVFSIEDVSPIVEQTIIEERFSSFTIKSRREVDFSNVGFYTPDFHDESGNILKNNLEIQKEYKNYMNRLFDKYNKLVESGVPKEDARFVLPYSYNSNIIMGIDAHTLKDMIIKLTKTKYKNIQELREFGEKLRQIAQEKMPYIMDEINKIQEKNTDEVDEYLLKKVSNNNYKIINSAKLLNYTPNIDDTIIISALMRRYQLDNVKATKLYDKLCAQDENFKKDIIRKIALNSDGLELTQVNFQYQIPLSFAVLTHLTRHRTHNIIVPDFTSKIDVEKYKTPPKIKNENKILYDKLYKDNKIMRDHFKNDYQIREEDLVYFILSGNMVNVITNMDGKTLKHILGLRECTKAQWETREMAISMHKEISKLVCAKNYELILGSTCKVEGLCNEGKESCRKVLKYKK